MSDITTNKMDLDEVLDYAQWSRDIILLNSKASQATQRNVDRGQVYWCKLGMGVGSEERKLRPVVIIQNNGANRNSPNVIVAPITHSRSELNTVVPIDSYTNNNGEVLLDGYAILGNIVCISKARLGNFITKLTKSDILKIDKAISMSLYTYHYYEKLKNRFDDREKYINKLNHIIAETKMQLELKDEEINHLKKEIDKLRNL